MRPVFKISLTVMIVMFVFAVPVYSADQQAAPKKTVKLKSLQDYLRVAAKNNAGLKSSFNNWKAAVEAVPQAKTLPDPKFTYSYFIEEVETRVGPQQSKIGFSQTFPWLGKIENRADAAALQAKAARKKYEAEKLNLFNEVKNSFYEFSYLHTAIEKTKQNLELIKHFEQVALTRYSTSSGSHPDVIRAQIELARLDDKLTTLKQMRQPIVARLNSHLNRKVNKALPWPKKPEYKSLKIDRKKIIAQISSANPQIDALKFQAQAAKENIALAEKRFYPDITFGMDWIQTDDALTSGVKDSGKDPVVAMFSVNVPLWADSYKAGVRQAKANLRKTSAKKKQKQNDLNAQGMKELFEFEDSSRKVKLYSGILIPKATEMLQASEVAYKGGSLDFLSLIDAQQTLLSFELILDRAKTDNLQSIAAIEKLVGTDISKLVAAD